MTENGTGGALPRQRDTTALDLRQGTVVRDAPAPLPPHETTAIDRDQVPPPPAADEAPSTLAIIGRYVLPAEVFAALRVTQPGAGGEIQLTDALATLVARGAPMHGVVFSGRRYDTGDRLDYLKAVIQLAVEREDLGPALRPWLQEFVADLPAQGASSS